MHIAHWTPRRLRILRELWPSLFASNAQLEDALGCGIRSIRRKAAELELGERPGELPALTKQRVEERIQNIYLTRGLDFSVEKIQLAVSDLWPDATREQIKAALARVAQAERMRARRADSVLAVESG